MLGHRILVAEDYFSILKRRWWIALVPTILLPIVAVAFSYTIQPQYLSQTLVLIESQKVPDSLVKPVISSDLDGRIASMKEQILSRSSLQPIIERYNLYPGSNISLDDRIDLARKDIAIKLIPSEVAHSVGVPGFFISFKANDPHTAQLVCSDITTLFTGENLRLRQDAAEGTTSFLASQLADAKRNLDEQDAKLAAFQRQYIGRLPGEEAPNINVLTSLNTQLEAATQALARMEQDRAYGQSLLAQQQGLQAGAVTAAGQQSLQAVPSEAQLAQQSELQTMLAQRTELLSHYTADYPDVVALDHRIADLRKQISRTPAQNAAAGQPAAQPHFDSPAVQQLRAQLRAADIGIDAKRKEQAQLGASVRTYQDRIQSSPLVEQQYKEVTRDYQTALTFYDDLLAKMNQSKMATDLEKRQQGEQFTVKDAANLPEAPFSPKRSVFLLGGILGGLILGMLIIALLEYKDTALSTERDVLAFMQLPTLAVIAYSKVMEERSPGRFRRVLRRKAKQANIQVTS